MKLKIAIAALLLPLATNAWCLLPDGEWLNNATLNELAGNSKESAPAVIPVKPVQPKQNSTTTKGEQSTKSNAKVISVADLLKGASTEAKLEFLDSLMLVDGKVASAKLDGLARELGQAKVQDLVATVSGGSRAVYKTSSDIHSTALCGNDVCYDTACRPASGGGRTCVDMKGYGCFSSCN